MILEMDLVSQGIMTLHSCCFFFFFLLLLQWVINNKNVHQSRVTRAPGQSKYSVWYCDSNVKLQKYQGNSRGR